VHWLGKHKVKTRTTIHTSPGISGKNGRLLKQKSAWLVSLPDRGFTAINCKNLNAFPTFSGLKHSVFTVFHKIAHKRTKWAGLQKNRFMAPD
jgi:hypothetical protein